MIRFWVMAVLLGAAAALSLLKLCAGGGGETRVDLVSALPLRLGAWEGREIGLDEGTLRLLGTRNTLLREYRRPGAGADEAPVLLCIVVSLGNHRVTHPPELCYEGQGWSIEEKAERDFEFPSTPPRTLRVTRLRMARKGVQEEVIAWYRTDASSDSSFLEQKLRLLLGSVFGESRWSALIRISTRAAEGEDPGDSRALGRLKDFGAALLPSLQGLDRELSRP